VLDVRVVTGAGGGPEKTILNSAQFLARSGYRNLCAYMHPPGDRGFEELRAKARRAGAPLFAVHDRGPWDWRVIPEFLHICRRERVRIWHGHDYKSNLLGLLLRKFWPMLLVTTMHGWVHYTRRTPIYYAIDRLCLRHYERVICVSADLQAACLALGVPARRCVLIKNGVDTATYRRRLTAEDAKKRLGIQAGRLVVGAVGRLSGEKGFADLIRCADQLLRNGLDLELLIVGDGDQKDSLQALIGRLGRQDRIRLLGYRADTLSLYEAMDVFALSSVREGLPNVVLEAMAMEVPVVATRIAGVPDLIRDGDNGYLVAPEAPTEMLRALARLLADVSLRAHFAAAARRCVEARHSFAGRMEQVRVLYDTLLGRAARPAPCRGSGTTGLQQARGTTAPASGAVGNGHRPHVSLAGARLRRNPSPVPM
jgi:glycosyltransferase involved in cell wall biosynthesis